MQTAALTFAAIGTAILFLGGIAAVGSAALPFQLVALVVGTGYLWIWAANVGRGHSWRAALLLLLSAVVAECVLAYFALFVEPHVRIFAMSAAPVLVLAVVAGYLAPAERRE
jgi:hypothetical protein